MVRKLKTPWRDGTSHSVMSPLEFMHQPAELRLWGGQNGVRCVCCGSISYSQGGRSNDRDLNTPVLRAGSANALRGHRRGRGPAVPAIPEGCSGTLIDGSSRSAGTAAACIHGGGRQHWQADDGKPPVQSALRNAINLSSGR